MKHETLFVDETTKKTMEQIHEGIIDSISDGLRSTAALSSIEKLAGEISGKFDAFQKTSDDISERVKGLEREIDFLKNTINNVLSHLLEAAAENNDVMIAQIKSLEMKIDVISTVIENQNRDSRLLGEINEKLYNLSLPFYKRIMKKLRKGNDIPSDANKENK